MMPGRARILSVDRMVITTPIWQQERQRTGDPVVQVGGLRMSYGRRETLHAIDLEVGRGEVFAFLGPNGAGKTTTVEILEGFRTRTGGDVEVLGSDPADPAPGWRERVGVVAQSSVPERNLTVGETVELYGGFYRAPLDTDRVLAITGLTDQAATRNRRLSGGQQRRLDLALALVGDPDLLFLDEPTTGFDPAARRAAWDTMATLRDSGKTIFLTTHHMEEAEVLADRIAVLVDGAIVALGTPAELRGRGQRPSTISFVASSIPSFTQAAGHDLPPGLSGAATEAGGRVRLRSADPAADLAVLLRWAEAGRFGLDGLEVTRPSLEQIYLDLTSPPNTRSAR
jgi:ABC-2 type transport system ATP-binding protein